MFSKLPELLVGGISLYLLGKEVTDNDSTKNQWKNAYDNECEENRKFRLENAQYMSQNAELHTTNVELQKEIQLLYMEKTKLIKTYSSLITFIEEEGYSVNLETGEITFEEDDDEPFDQEPDEDEEFHPSNEELTKIMDAVIAAHELPNKKPNPVVSVKYEDPLNKGISVDDNLNST